MTSANVTRRALSLGSADATTGWYAKSFSETTIDMVIRPRGSSFIYPGAGFYSRYEVTGYTEDGVVVGDEIVDSAGYRYLVEGIDEEWWLDNFVYRACKLVRRPNVGDVPDGSATMTVKDPRERAKTYLDTYITAANIKKANGSTNATTHVHYASPPYPLENVFVTKAVDALFSITTPDSRPIVDWDGTVVGYIESTPIDIFTADKTGVSGTELRWSCEAELRRIVETYPISTTYRSLSRMSDGEQDMGGWKLYSVRYILTYQRDVT